MEFPKFASVNGQLQSAFYSIKENDKIEMLNFYTVKQIIEFMDVILDNNMNIYVNNQIADMDTKVYENFSVVWTLEILELPEVEVREESVQFPKEAGEEAYEPEKEGEKEAFRSEEEMQKPDSKETVLQEQTERIETEALEDEKATTIHIIVNKKPLTLSGKKDYIFVDVFDFIDFDLSKPQGTSVGTVLNGKSAGFTQFLSEGDVLDIFWKKE